MKDLTEMKFGKLEGIRLYRRIPKISGEYKDGYRYFWIFRCECGKEKIINQESVVRGLTKSCGCIQKEKWNNIITKHKFSRTRFYRIYQALKQRCEYKNGANYYRYGGRGIKNKWNSFLEFKDDMYENYLKHCTEYGTKNTSIDRINNDSNYCKENCRWATNEIQQANTRRKKKVITDEVFNQIKTLKANNTIITL